MTVETEAGYSWTDGKYARIVHDGNRQKFHTFDASSEVAGYLGANVDSGDTVDSWRPFSNDVLSPSDLSDTTNWTTSNLSVGSDGKTLDEGTASSTTHYISQAFTFTANEFVVACQFEKQTVAGLRLEVNDGTSTFHSHVDLATLNLTTLGGVTESTITDLGNNKYEFKLVLTPAAGTGYIRLYTTDGSSITYTGTNKTLKICRVSAHLSGAVLKFNSLTSAANTVCAIAGHNLGSGGQGRFVVSHDSNADGTYTSIAAFNTVANDSPILVFFDAVTSKDWQLTIARTVLPEVKVVWWADPLKMERPFYAGYTPSRMNRNTEVIGNLSGSGSLLGRSKKRTTLNSPYSWNNLSYSWVRSNLDGPTGLIQAAENNPLFVAWRPELTDDVDYVMRASVDTVPAAAGVRDLWQFSLSGEVFSYE